MAVLINDPASTESVSTFVLLSRGVSYGTTIGFDWQLADYDGAVSSLAPGEMLPFLFATVGVPEDVEPGTYTIDFATINGFNVPEQITASNVVSFVVPEPSVGLLGSVLALAALIARASATPRVGSRTRSRPPAPS